MPIAALQSQPFDVIRCDDPRLRASCPAVAALGSATLAQMASSADPATARVLGDAAEYVRSWARRTAAAPLDDLVAELLQAWERLRPTENIHPDRRPRRRPRRGLAPPLRPAVRQAVARRLGLLGDAPASLTACVPGTGIKIERLRQLTLQLQVVATGWVWAPALDQALELGRNPVDRHEYAATLHNRGLSRRPWYPEAVNALARLCGRHQQVATYPDLDRQRLLATARQVIAGGRVGVAPLGDVATAVAEHQQRPVTAQQVAAGLAAGSGGLATDGTWVWRTGTGRRTPRMLRVAQGMLAVAGPLPIPTVHHGWCRRLRGRGVRTQPPVDALDAVLRAEPAFVVDDQPDDAPLVRLARPLRPDQIYGRAVTTLILAIRTAPGRVVTRREMDRAATNAGVTIDAVSQYLSYHEVFARHGPSLWTLVGVEADPRAADAARTPPEP